jgi:uncharacterized protein (TIGR02246 family)
MSTNAQPSLDTREHIGRIICRWADAWNAHDPAALAELVDANVDFVTVAGRWLQGVQEFAEWHGEIHRRHMRDSCWSNIQCRLRQLDDHLCLVHLEWTTVGDRNLEGALRSPRHGIFTWLVARWTGSWRIIAAHNTELRDESRHRLEG